MSRITRSVKTFSATLAAAGSGVVVGLVTMPLLLRWLGDERCGAYRVAMEWLGYASLLDFGLVGTIQVLVARAVGRGDRAGVIAAVHAGVRAAFWLAGVTVLVSVSLVFAAPTLIRGLTGDLVWELQVGLIVGLLGVLWTPLVAFRPLAEASQRGYIVQLCLTAQNLTTAGLMLGLAAAGFGLPGQFLAFGVGSGVAALILAWDGIRRYPEILSRGRPPASSLPHAFSGQMFLYQICARVSLMSDCIVVGFVLGPMAVVTFSVTQRLILLANTLVMAVATSAWAALAELHHQKQDAQFNHRLTQLTRLTGVIAFGLFVPLGVWNSSFVALWVGEIRYGGVELTLLTALFSWFLALVGLWGWPLVTTGRVRTVLPILVTSAVLNLGLSIAATAEWGVAGPALGSAVSLGLVNLWWMPVVLRRQFGTPLRPLARAVAGPALVGVPLAIALYLASSIYPVNELAIPFWARWCVLGGAMTLTTIVYCVLAWSLVLTHEDRGELRTRLFRR